MKKLITLLYFSMIALSASSQYVIDLSKFDYLDVKNDYDISGYVEEKGSYLLYSDFDYIPEKDSITFSQTPIQSNLNSEYLKVKDIPKYTLKDWNKFLEKSDIIVEDASNNPNELCFLVKKSPYLMIKMVLSNEEQYKNKYENITLDGKKYNTLVYDDCYTINYLKLKGGKYVLLLINENGYLFKIIDKNLKLSHFKIEQATRVANFSVNLSYSDVLEIEQNTKEKYSFVDDHFRLPIGIRGDSILRIKNGPTSVYLKDKNKYDLYDLYLNKIEHNYNIRTVKANNNWLSLLIGNKIFYLVNDTIEENPFFPYTTTIFFCGVVNHYSDTIVNERGNIRIKKMINSSMTKGTKEFTNYIILNQSNIDSLFFFDNIITQKYSDNNFEKHLKNIFLGKKNNSKYNIFKYKEISKNLISKEDKKLSIIERENQGITNNEFYEGTIELVPLLDTDVDSVVFDKYPIVFKQGNRYGIYPIKNDAKYKQLDIQNESGFIRYMKPGGEQGWLDLNNGKEYTDI